MKKKARTMAEQTFKDTESFSMDLEGVYRKALSEIKTELQAFYSKYALENQITMEEAQKLLNSIERKDLMARHNIRVPSRITRLQALQTSISQHLEPAYRQYETATTDFLKSTTQKSIESTVNNVRDVLGIKADFSLQNARAVNQVLTTNWSGKNFSERIWGQKDRLENNIKKTLTDGIIRGSSVKEMSLAMAERMDVGYSDAKRLVMTETSYVVNQGTLQGYLESGVVEQYQYIAEIDSHTSEICQALDGMIFDLKEAKAGVNYPPMHPNCRSTVIGVL